MWVERVSGYLACVGEKSAWSYFFPGAVREPPGASPVPFSHFSISTHTPRIFLFVQS